MHKNAMFGKSGNFRALRAAFINSPGYFVYIVHIKLKIISKYKTNLKILLDMTRRECYFDTKLENVCIARKAPSAKPAPLGSEVKSEN